MKYIITLLIIFQNGKKVTIKHESCRIVFVVKEKCLYDTCIFDITNPITCDVKTYEVKKIEINKKSKQKVIN